MQSLSKVGMNIVCVVCMYLCKHHFQFQSCSSQIVAFKSEICCCCQRCFGAWSSLFGINWKSPKIHDQYIALKHNSDMIHIDLWNIGCFHIFGLKKQQFAMNKIGIGSDVYTNTYTQRILCSYPPWIMIVLVLIHCITFNSNTWIFRLVQYYILLHICLLVLTSRKFVNDIVFQKDCSQK